MNDLFNSDNEIAELRAGAGQCRCCGRPLSNPVSVGLGIGPVCRNSAMHDGGPVHPLTDEANFDIVEDSETVLIIRDLGPWDQYKTITNAAEWVVEQLAPRLGRRRLLYFDSSGVCDELKVEAGRFAGFAPGPGRRLRASP